MTTQEAHDRAASLFGDHAITDEYQGQLSIMLHRILNGQAEYLTIGTGRTWTEDLNAAVEYPNREPELWHLWTKGDRT